jgi:hypothetical protein
VLVQQLPFLHRKVLLGLLQQPIGEGYFANIVQKG